MGFSNFLRSTARIAVKSTKNAVKIRTNNMRLASHLKSTFKNPVSGDELTVGDFIAELFGKEGFKDGWGYRVSHPELLDFLNVTDLISYPFENNCCRQLKDQYFSSSQDTLHNIKLMLKKCKELEDRRDYVLELIEATLAPIDFQDYDDYEFQIFSFLNEGLEKLKECSIEKSAGKSANKHFQIWLEETVDPIIKLVNDQRIVQEKLLAGSLPIEAHIKAFRGFLENDAELDDLIGENQGEMVQLYRAMHDAFERKGLIAINRLATVPKDVHRINQIETIIDLYSLKIKRVKEDENLSDDERQRKVEAWKHLMEKDVEALGGAV